MYPLIDSLYSQLLSVVFSLFAIAVLFRKALSYYRQGLLSQKYLVDRINHALPQTQCGQCGHRGCLPYAQAIARGQAINKCPPGGDETIRNLARLLNETAHELDPAHGQISPLRIAVIREDECIGCTKCIQACPVDAILGGAKLMHTVVEAECTGCDLCVEPCPVDCIDMIRSNQLEEIHWQTSRKREAEPAIAGSSL